MEVISDVIQEKGYAKVTDVARRLNVGLSAVSEMFQKLSNEGYIDYEKYSGVTLRKKGKKLATSLRKKHETLRDFLIILGLDKGLADDDACNIEHVIKPDTMRILTSFVEFVERHEDPLWLERFRVYYETGELPECPRTIGPKGKSSTK